MPWFPVAHWKVPFQMSQKVLTMQVDTWVLWNTKANNGKHGTLAPTYKENEKCVSFHRQCGAWVLVLPWQTSRIVWGSIKGMGSKPANSPQHVAGEDSHQSLEGGGVGTWRCHVLVALEVVFLPCHWNIMYPSSCALWQSLLGTPLVHVLGGD